MHPALLVWDPKMQCPHSHTNTRQRTLLASVLRGRLPDFLSSDTNADTYAETASPSGQRVQQTAAGSIALGPRHASHATMSVNCRCHLCSMDNYKNTLGNTHS